MIGAEPIEGSTMKGKRSHRLAVVFVLFAASGVVTAAALATYPGTNGRVAYRRYFNGDHTKSALYTSKSDGSGETRITHAPAKTFDDQPDWSPDGGLIAFTRCGVSSACAVYIVHADGSGLKQLSSACTSGPPKCVDDANVSFLPDGKHVVFTRSTGGEKHWSNWDQIQHSDLVVSDLNGQHLQKILGSKPYAGDYNFAAFSRDGKRFVYERANSPLSKPSLRSALFVANKNGSGEHRITPWSLDAGDNPDWSPDGNWIVFRTQVRADHNSQIDIIHPDGSGLKQLTHFTPSANVRSAAFSPDGKQIVLATDDSKGGNPDVYVMNLDGSDLHAITHNPLWDSAADWGTAP
jgi:TolB protein